MRFKTDENIPTEAVDLLRAAGHDVVTVFDQDRWRAMHTLRD